MGVPDGVPFPNSLEEIFQREGKSGIISWAVNDGIIYRGWILSYDNF